MQRLDDLGGILGHRQLIELGMGRWVTLVLVAPGPPMLDYLPVGLFGSVMGVTGLSVALRLAQARYDAPDGISERFPHHS
jgi:hypothetical protein